ncbi:MAG: hypothetical protein LUO93_10295 [Methanomicrobiales archaeon]|nr:hypothetical protein [Methanomicrobiales archaeon]
MKRREDKIRDATNPFQDGDDEFFGWNEGWDAAMATRPTETAYTRAQLADAVDRAHDAMHVWEEQAGPGHPLHEAVTEAHEALHAVGAGSPRVGCSTPDPEVQVILSDLRRLADKEMSCGHKVEDLIGGTGADGNPLVTKCGACLADAQARKKPLSEDAARVRRMILEELRSKAEEWKRIGGTSATEFADEYKRIAELASR